MSRSVREPVSEQYLHFVPYKAIQVMTFYGKCTAFVKSNNCA